MAETAQGIQKAGSLDILELKLVSATNVIWNLSDFLVELNIFEDIFSNYLHGNMVVSDSRNLIEKAPMIGEEFLVVKFKSPTFPEAATISKTFRVFKISDRNIVRDNNTQTFVMHFASIELFYDILLPLFVPFEGKITDVVSKIFIDFISANREFQISEASDEIKEIDKITPLTILNDTKNKVKFVSPGWSPFKCINWLASKSIPDSGIGKNFLFFESNKSFYFGSMEYIFSETVKDQTYIGTYSISASNIRDGMATPDINREYFIAKNINMIDTTDHVKNYTNGYLASRLITLDIYNKEYKFFDYDYAKEYFKQFHTSGSGNTSIPVFSKDTLRNFFTHISYYPVNPKLYDDFKDNINEKMGEIYGNRKSSMLDLSNIKMHMTIPGRSDIEVGNILYLSYPALGAKDNPVTNKEDKNYSGYYLLTAIHHKINKMDYSMIVEGIKDSLYINPTSGIT